MARDPLQREDLKREILVMGPREGERQCKEANGPMRKRIGFIPDEAEHRGCLRMPARSTLLSTLHLVELRRASGAVLVGPGFRASHFDGQNNLHVRTFNV